LCDDTCTTNAAGRAGPPKASSSVSFGPSEIRARQLTVRDPKWKHDRVTMLPAATVAEIHEQLTRAMLDRKRDDNVKDAEVR